MHRHEYTFFNRPTYRFHIYLDSSEYKAGKLQFGQAVRLSFVICQPYNKLLLVFALVTYLSPIHFILTVAIQKGKVLWQLLHIRSVQVKGLSQYGHGVISSRISSAS